MKPMRAGYEHRPITAAFRGKCRVCGGEILKGHKITRPDDKTPFRHADPVLCAAMAAKAKDARRDDGDQVLSRRGNGK
jgi:hypothetical protein